MLKRTVRKPAPNYKWSIASGSSSELPQVVDVTTAILRIKPFPN